MPERKPPRWGDQRRPHIFVRGAARTEAYAYPGGGGTPKKLPERDRISHAQRLLASLDRARTVALKRQEEVKALALPTKKGVHLEFESEPGFDLELQSLDSRSPNGIQLVAVRDRKRTASGAKNTTLKELQIFDLPWPLVQLRELGEVNVQLRVTLSYFVEPNPSERGHQYRHRYSSHGFRFDVRGATESLEDFRKRLNKEARAKGEGSPATSDLTGWSLGTDRRHRGSIHSDVWTVPAVDLANRQHLAVYPVSGWWKERHNLERWRRKARYSLIVSIHAPEIEVDLYTPVESAVGIRIET